MGVNFSLYILVLVLYILVYIQIQGYVALPSISHAGFVLSEKSRCLFPHTWGQGSHAVCSGSIVVTTLDCGPGGSWFESRVGANILWGSIDGTGLTSLHPFGVVHWVPVLSNIKTATGCESKSKNICCFLDGWPPNSSSRDLLFLRLSSCYQRDLGVYIHIFEVQDHDNDIINNAMLTVDLQIQGQALCCVAFHISRWVRAIGEISVSISTYLRSRITRCVQR